MTDDETKPKSKGGRPATGAVITLPDGRFQAVVTLNDGTKKRMPEGGFPKGTRRALGKEKALFWTEEWRARDMRRPLRHEAYTPGDEWWGDYLKARDTKGLSPVRFLYTPHIKPVLAGKHPKDWSREDCERLV